MPRRYSRCAAAARSDDGCPAPDIDARARLRSSAAAGTAGTAVQTIGEFYLDKRTRVLQIRRESVYFRRPHVTRSSSAAFIAAGLIGSGALLAQGRAAQKAPDDPAYSLESRAAIGAHHICAGLWVVGGVYKRSAEEIVAQDIAPFKDFSWDKSFQYRVDNQSHTVTVSGPGTPPRTAKFNNDQGCAILPRGEPEVHFKPTAVPRKLPDPATQAWPTGDMGATAPVPDGVDRTAVNAALDWGMAQTQHNTRAIVAVYKGKIVGERYAPGWTKDTPQISWSEGKSITAALIGLLARQGRLRVDDFAPVKE